MVAVINYGMGNTGSIVNMLHRIGEEAVVTDKRNELEEADKIILPGVGAFDHGIQNLREKDLVDVIRRVTLEKRSRFWVYAWECNCWEIRAKRGRRRD